MSYYTTNYKIKVPFFHIVNASVTSNGGYTSKDGEEVTFYCVEIIDRLRRTHRVGDRLTLSDAEAKLQLFLDYVNRKGKR